MNLPTEDPSFSPRRAARAAREAAWAHASDADDATGAPEPEPAPRRRRGCLVALMVFVAIFALGIGGVYLAFGSQISAYLAKMQAPSDYSGNGTGEVNFTISTGDSGSVIAKNLASAGITASYQIFYDLLLRTKPEPIFQPGVYRLAKQMSAQAALQWLQDPAKRIENTFRIKEGQWLPNALKTIADATKIPIGQLTALAAQPQLFGLPPEAKTLEGFLFPAIYTFVPDTSAKDVLTRVVQRAFQSLDAAGVAPADRWRMVIIASLIQREDGSEQDAPKVSRVIRNRLNPALFPLGLLQFDSTVHYGIGDASQVTTTPEQRADASNPYNTYLHPGLTPGPIGAPSDIAIRAALKPADGPWLYFVTVNPQTGETVFSTTLAQHEVAVKQFQQWLRDHPDWGS